MPMNIMSINIHESYLKLAHELFISVKQQQMRQILAMNVNKSHQ